MTYKKSQAQIDREERLAKSLALTKQKAEDKKKAAEARAAKRKAEYSSKFHKARVKRERAGREEATKLEQKVTQKASIAGAVLTTEQVEGLRPQSQQYVEENVVFKPNEGPQTDFLAAPERDVLYGGQAGGGKSYSLIVDPLRYAHKAKHRALILRKSLPELGELIDNTRELYPKAFPGAKYQEAKKMWVFPSGAKIMFGYLERDSDVYQYQGRAYSWIGFDEITHLPTEFAWNYLASRLRTTDPEIKCYMRATTNPGGVGHAWVKARYIDPAPANKAFSYGKNKQTGEELYRKFIPAKLKDNPYLFEDGDYQTMLETLPEIERRRLLDGDWNINEGVAFPEFQRDLHVIEPFAIPSSWFRFKGADYGYTSPSAVLWFAVDPDDNTIICYKELYAKGLTGEALADTIMEMEMMEVSNIAGVLDTAAWNKTGYTGPTIGQILNSAGCSFRPSDKNRIAGKIQIHERLKLSMSTRPKIQFFKTCKNIIRELESLPVSATNSEDVDTTASDHAYDALRYALMSRPRMSSPAERAGLIRQEVSWEASDNEFGY
jgi:hypothetical protein